MAILNGEWIQTYALPLLQSVIPTRVSDFLMPPTSTCTNGPQILNAPSNLHSMRSRFLLFLACSSLLISFVWCSISISLYPLGIEYQVMNAMYESRWLPSTILFAGTSALLLAIFKYESFFILCSISSIYNCASCFVVVVVYSIDFRKALLMMHPPITLKMSGHPRKKYLQLCGCMIVVALLALFMGILLLIKLRRLASLYFAPLNLQNRQRVYLLFSSMVQLPFVWFSIYVSAHVISLQFSYVQQYMIQELLCALILHCSILAQILTARQTRTNSLTLKLLLFLNLCQCVQEIFYTWNSYYISLYIHSSKAKLAVGGRADQYLMGINFLGHFLRMYLSASTAYNLASWLSMPLINTKFDRYELSIGVRRLLIFLSLFALALSIAHFAMDICYTMATHIYRTLIAFTGISVFYLCIIGVCSILFLRTNKIVLLIISFVFTLLLLGVSTHGLYIYMDMSYNNVLLTHLETLGKDKRQPSLMHFVEACLSLLALILCFLNGNLVFRLLHIDSRHDRRDLRLKNPLLLLFLLGLFQLTLTVVNAVVFMSIKDEPRVFQSMLAYGILDTLSALVLCLTQLYVSRPSNSHLNYGLSALLFLLICETLTTYNYLSTKTAYVQLLIVFNRMFASNTKLSSKNRLTNLFPNEEVALMIASHVLQLVQWFLMVASLTLTGLTLELLYEQRRALAVSPNVGREAVSEASISRYTVSSIISNEAGPSNRVESCNGNDSNSESKPEKNLSGSYDNPVYDSPTKTEEGGGKEQRALLEQGPVMSEENRKKDEKTNGDDRNDNEKK